MHLKDLAEGVGKIAKGAAKLALKGAAKVAKGAKNAIYGVRITEKDVILLHTETDVRTNVDHQKRVVHELPTSPMI